MPKSSSLVWRCRDRQITVGRKTLIMGVLNVTPDSFSDGGRYFDLAAAMTQAEAMAAAGADIIDVGGESSRPGAEPVSEAEEARRVLPVIQELARRFKCLISVDTTKPAVARHALEAGAHIINDISALTLDPDMVGVAKKYRAGVVLMHMQGEPRSMQKNPKYGNVVKEVREFLLGRTTKLMAEGIIFENMAVDPGLGFGKTVEHNLKLLAGLPQLAECCRPIIVGLSRKSFLGKVTGLEVEDRLAPSLAGLAYAITRGAHIIRVHDVKESCAAAHLLDMLKQEQSG
jgi:dihydropteroate synthase